MSAENLRSVIPDSYKSEPMSFNNDTSAKLNTLSEFVNEFEPEIPAAMYKSLWLISNNYMDDGN